MYASIRFIKNVPYVMVRYNWDDLNTHRYIPTSYFDDQEMHIVWFAN